MIRTLAAALATTTCFMALATPAAAQTRAYNIPAGSLRSALDAYARQSGRQVIYRGDEVRSARSRGARGSMAAEAALNALLAGSGFNVRTDSSGALAIVKVGNGAAVDRPTAEQNLSGDGQAAIGDQDIVVTAQKQGDQRLGDVPIPITVVKGMKLAENGQVRIQDYYNQIPGLNIGPSKEQQILSIRGIITGPGSDPTVGITIDDIPFGPSLSYAGGNDVPELDPSDIARLEVLRGPQGTLYGSNSMGGLLRYVTVDPSTDGVFGSVQAGLQSVHYGDKLGYSVRGALNLPVSENLAVRVSAFSREDPGYIDSPTYNAEDVNRVKAYGGRISALWTPSEDFSLKISALLQNYRADGTTSIQTPLNGPNLTQPFAPEISNYKNDIRLYTATLKYEVAPGLVLTSLTGFNTNRPVRNADITYAFSAFIARQYPGVTGAYDQSSWSTDKLTQEFRVSGRIGSNLSLLGGLFYSHEKSDVFEDIYGYDLNAKKIVGEYAHIPFPSTQRQYAGFVNATYSFSERFEVQVGGRFTAIRTKLDESFIGPYSPAVLGKPSPNVLPTLYSKANFFNYLFAPKFTLREGLMIYGRMSSGFRPGAANLNGVPYPYDPDTTQNYEVGLKGDFFDKVLLIDASAYHIDWKDIQIFGRNPVTQLSYTFNGTEAKSQGVEFSLGLRPAPFLRFDGWVSYNRSILTEPLPVGAYGVAGDRLPYAPSLTGNLSIELEAPINNELIGRVGGNLSYVGNRKGRFTANSTIAREVYPEYTQINLHVGVQRADWSINAYVNNVTNSRARLSGGVGSSPNYIYYLVQPRTVGVTITKHFGQ